MSPYSPCPKSVSLEQVPLRTSTRIRLHSEAFVLHGSEVCHDFSMYSQPSKLEEIFPFNFAGRHYSSQQFYLLPYMRKMGFHHRRTAQSPMQPVAERGHGSSPTPDRSTVSNTTLHPQQDPLYCIPAPKKPSHPTLPSHPTQTPPLDSPYIL